MTVAELIRFIERYAEHCDAPVRTGLEVTSVSAGDAGYVVTTSDGTWDADAVVLATGAFNRPKVPALAASLPERARAGHDAGLQAARRAAPGPRAGGRRVGHRACRSPTSCCAPAARSRSRSASTCGCRGPTGAATSCGGWIASGVSTSATTRSTTSSAHATSPPRSSSARRIARTSTSTRSRRAAPSSSGAWRRSATATRCSPARCATSATSPTSSSLGCSRPSRRGRGGGRPTATVVPAPTRPWSPTRPGSTSTCRPAATRPCSGRPGTAPTTRGWTCRSSTARASCATTAASCATRPGLYRIGLNFLRRRKSSFIHGAEDDADRHRRASRRAPRRRPAQAA